MGNSQARPEWTKKCDIKREYVERITRRGPRCPITLEVAYKEMVHLGTGVTFTVCTERGWPAKSDQVSELEPKAKVISDANTMCSYIQDRVGKLSQIDCSLITVLVTDGQGVKEIAAVEKSQLDLRDNIANVCQKVKNVYDMGQESSKDIYLNVNARRYLADCNTIIVGENGRLPSRVQIGQVVKGAASTLEKLGAWVSVGIAFISLISNVANPPRREPALEEVLQRVVREELGRFAAETKCQEMWEKTMQAHELYKDAMLYLGDKGSLTLLEERLSEVNKKTRDAIAAASVAKIDARTAPSMCVLQIVLVGLRLSALFISSEQCCEKMRVEFVAAKKRYNEQTTSLIDKAYETMKRDLLQHGKGHDYDPPPLLELQKALKKLAKTILSIKDARNDIPGCSGSLRPA